jgi:hypothetical protein
MSEQNGEVGEIGEIRDLEQFNERRRYEDIHDARARVPAVRELISDPAYQRQHTLQERHTALFEAVKSYAFELEWSIRERAERKYWDTYDLGEITIAPPPAAVEYYREHERSTGADQSEPAPRRHSVVGLGEFVELDPPFREAWEVEWGDRNGMESERFTAAQSVPRSVSDRAYRACNQFTYEVGVAIDINDSEDGAGWDASDYR